MPEYTVTYLGNADRAIPFPNARVGFVKRMVFTREKRTYKGIPADYAWGLQFEPDRWRVEEYVEEESNVVPTAAGTEELTITKVLDWVGSDPFRARKALRTERNRGPDDQRSTLIDKLEKIIEENT